MKKDAEAALPSKWGKHIRVPCCPTYQINEWLESLSPEARALTLGSLFDDGPTKRDLPPGEA